MTNSYHDIRDMRGRFAEKAGVSLDLSMLGSGSGNYRSRSPAELLEQLNVPKGPRVIIMPADFVQSPDYKARMEQRDLEGPRGILRPPEGWAKALEKLDALEKINARPKIKTQIITPEPGTFDEPGEYPFDTVDAIAPQGIADDILGDWKLDRSVVAEMMSEVPHGMQINWSKVKMAALTGLLPIAIFASQHISAYTTNDGAQAKPLLKASVAHHAMMTELPKAPAINPAFRDVAPKPEAKSEAKAETKIEAKIEAKPAEAKAAAPQRPWAPAPVVQPPAPKTSVAASFAETSCGEYKAPASIDALLRELTQGDADVSYEAMHCLLGSESGFRNVTSDTGAVGIGQWTEGPFLERLTKIKKFLSDDERKIADNIRERKVKLEGGKHRIVYEGKGRTPAARERNRDAALDLRNDDRIALIATREDIRAKIDEAKKEYRLHVSTTINILRNSPSRRAQAERIAHLEAQLNRPWTVTDVKIVYFAGVRGGVELLAAYADPAKQDQKASDHTASVVSRNNKPVFKDGREDRSVAEVIEYMQDRVGAGLLPGEKNDVQELALAR